MVVLECKSPVRGNHFSVLTIIFTVSVSRIMSAKTISIKMY